MMSDRYAVRRGKSEETPLPFACSSDIAFAGASSFFVIEGCFAFAVSEVCDVCGLGGRMGGHIFQMQGSGRSNSLSGR